MREIYTNLEGDLEDFEHGFDLLHDKRNSCQDLLNIIEQDLPFDDSFGYYLNYLRVYPRFDHNSSGYQLLKTKGLDLIRNDELREAITNLYELRYPDLVSRENENIEIMLMDLRSGLKLYEGIETLKVAKRPESLTISDEHVEQGRFRTMINFDRLKKDTEFHWVIKDVEFTSAIEIGRYERTKNDVEALLKLLEAELE